VLQEDTVRLPAGWYPDPTGLPQLRWWDNHAWTQHTTAARQPLIVQEPRVSYAEPLPTRRSQREREREETSAGRSTPQLDPPFDRAEDATLIPIPDRSVAPPTEEDARLVAEEDAAAGNRPADAAGDSDLDSDLDSAFGSGGGEDALAGYRPVSAFGHANHGGQEARASAEFPSLSDEVQEPVLPPFDFAAAPATGAVPTSAPATGAIALGTSTTVGTAPAWVIALLPLVQLVLTLLFVTGFGASTALQFVIPGIIGLVYLAVIVLAIFDRAILVKAGRATTAHWAWAFLTAPVYLIARALTIARDSGRGFGPVLVWLALAMLQLGSVLAVPGLLIATAPGTFSAQAEHAVEAEAAAFGVPLTLSCPSTPPVLIGQSYDCAATDATGEKGTVVVSLQRLNGWIDWRVDDWGVYKKNIGG
jgi:hypothetical protein